MLKIARKLFVILALLFTFSTDSLAFDFAGLKGTDRDDPDNKGKIEDVNWPPEFVAESEAIQASMIKKLSVYQNWEFSRTFMVRRIKLITYKDLGEGRTTFEEGDRIRPISNKCEKTESAEKPVYTSDYLSIIIGEWHYVGEFGGSGWGCRDKILRPYWWDRKDVFEAGGRPLKKADDIAQNSTDSMVIIDFLARTRDLNHKFKIDDKANLLFDRWGGRTYDALLEGRNFIVAYCVCKEDEEEDAFSKVGKFFAPKN